MDVEFVVRRFGEMSGREVHDLLRLRAEVFVVEQDCVYLDPDGRDLVATHLLGRQEGRILCCARWMEEADGLHLGRIVTATEIRGKGFGHALMRAALARIGDRRIVMDAQSHLRGYYGAHGFLVEGEEFLLDGIPHLHMVRNAGVRNAGGREAGR